MLKFMTVQTENASSMMMSNGKIFLQATAAKGVSTSY